MSREPFYRGAIEEVGVVFEGARQLGLRLGHRQMDVVLRRSPLERYRLKFKPAEIHSRAGIANRKKRHPPAGRQFGFLKSESGLENRRAAEVSWGAQPIDQQRKREFLMVQRFGQAPPRLRKKRREREIAREVGAQRQHVGEVPDHRLQFTRCSSRGRRSDYNLFLARVAIQQSLESREQRCKHRDSAAAADCAEPVGRRPVDFERKGGAPISSGRRPFSIRGKVQRRRIARQAVSPITPERLTFGRVQQFRFPEHIIAIPRGQRWERGFKAGCFSMVENAEFVHDQRQRPEIDNQMVDTQQEIVFVRRSFEEQDFQQRS